MKIVEFFTSDRQEHWLREIEKSDWAAGSYLARQLKAGQVKNIFGETALVLLLVDGDSLVSFCTYAPLDDIQPTDLTPWVGYLYTFLSYRGHRYAGKLLECAESLVAIMGKDALYLSSNDPGLYEKYGFSYFRTEKNVWGEETAVYRKLIRPDDAGFGDKQEQGNTFKAQIVSEAKKHADPIACCGFSCRHCFLGEWCGGCKSSFNCCSFGTLYPKGKCPNVVCVQERGIDGCYACEKLNDCRVGFYREGNDGAEASKAQALFVKKYGKDALLKVHDLLHEKYSFRKTQEILGDDVDSGLKILEKVYSTVLLRT